MIEAFEKQPDLVAAQPKIKDLNDPQRFEYAGAAGGYLDLFGYPFCRGRIVDILELDDHQYDKSQLVFWASGARLFLRREAFERVGAALTKTCLPIKRKLICAGVCRPKADRFNASLPLFII